MDTTRIAHPAPEPTPRERRGLTLYREHGEGIEMIAPDFYLVPSASGAEFYHVDYAGETCDCPDYRRHHGASFACKHVYAVGIKLAKRRAKTVRCDGCGKEFPHRELVEAMEDDLGVFEGERYCRPCAGRVGVR